MPNWVKATLAVLFLLFCIAIGWVMIINQSEYGNKVADADASQEDSGEPELTANPKSWTGPPVHIAKEKLPTTPKAVPSVPALKGVSANGNAFYAVGLDGIERPTLAVVLGDIPGSARSTAGLAEEIWIQGVVVRKKDGGIRDQRGKVIDPADIRNQVGTTRTWKPLAGYTGVTVQCVVIQAGSGHSPEGCSPA